MTALGHGAQPLAAQPLAGRLFRDSAGGIAGTVVSRATGMVRLLVIAAVFGATVLGSMVGLVAGLPLLLLEIIGVSVLPALVVPTLQPLLRHGSAAARQRVVSSLLGTVLLLNLLLVPAVLGRRVIADMLVATTPEALRGPAADVVAQLLLWVLPTIGMYLLIGLCVSVQAAHQRFRVAAAAPAIENLVLVTVLLIVATRAPGGTEVDRIGLGTVRLIGQGVLLAVSAHLATQLWAVHRLGLRLRPARPDLQMLTSLRTPAIQGAVSSGATGLRFLLASLAAATIPGGVVAMQLGLAVYSVPTALAGRPVGAAALPQLNRPGFGSPYGQALRIVSLVAVPAAAAMAALSPLLGEALTIGSFRQDGGTGLLVAAVSGLALGALADALSEVGRQVLIAVRRGHHVLTASVVRVVVTLAGIAGALAVAEDMARMLLIGAAMSAGDVLGLVAVHKPLRGGLIRRRRLAVAIAIGTSIASLLAVWLDDVLRPWLSGTAPLRLAVVGSVAVVTYALVVMAVAGRAGSLRADLVEPELRRGSGGPPKGRGPNLGSFGSGAEPQGGLMP